MVRKSWARFRQSTKTNVLAQWDKAMNWNLILCDSRPACGAGVVWPESLRNFGFEHFCWILNWLGEPDFSDILHILRFFMVCFLSRYTLRYLRFWSDVCKGICKYFEKIKNIYYWKYILRIFTLRYLKKDHFKMNLKMIKDLWKWIKEYPEICTDFSKISMSKQLSFEIP